MQLVTIQESIVILASLLLVILALVIVYWRFLKYRKAARDRFLKEQERARREGLEVPKDVVKELEGMKRSESENERF